MGYTTDFTGYFEVTPALTAEQLAILNKFAKDRHENYEAEGKPDYYCQWIPDKTGTRIEWDGNEKFYGYIGWIEYMIRSFFNPWCIKLNGEVGWHGEEDDDVGTITITNNVVTVCEGKNGGFKAATKPILSDLHHARVRTMAVTAHGTTLERATEAELRAALKNLEDQKYTPPSEVLNPNFGRILDAARTYVTHLSKNGRSPKDGTHYLFGEVMKTIYGPKYFDWHNKVCKD